MLLALAACNSGGSADGDAPDSTSPAATSDEGGSNEGGSEEQTASKGTIKVGHICDLTGVQSLTGQQAKQSMDFAKKYVGPMAGYDVEIIHVDSQSDSSAAADAARHLVEDEGVSVIIGPTIIGQKFAVANYCAEAGVPLIFYNPSPESLFESCAWAVGASGANPQMPSVMADYVFNELGYTKVYTLTKDDAGGAGYMDPFVAGFEDLGGEIVLAQLAPEGTTDFSSYLVRMDPEGADCIVGWTSAADAIQLWKDYVDSGLNEKIPIVGNFSGAFTDSFICDAMDESGRSDVAEAILGTKAPMSYAYNIDTPENNAFVEAWTAEFGERPLGNNLPGATTQVMLLLKAAVESLDGDISDSQALLDALLGADITGPEGRTVFVDGQHAATKDIYVTEVVKLDDGTYNYGLVKLYSDVAPSGLPIGG